MNFTRLLRYLHPKFLEYEKPHAEYMVDVLAWYIENWRSNFSFNLIRDSAWTHGPSVSSDLLEATMVWHVRLVNVGYDDDGHSTQIRTVVGFWVSSCVQRHSMKTQQNQDDNDSDQWNDETRDTIRIELFHLLRETFSGSVGGSSFALCFNCANIRTSHSRKCSTIWILFISYSGLRTMLE